MDRYKKSPRRPVKARGVSTFTKVMLCVFLIGVLVIMAFILYDMNTPATIMLRNPQYETYQEPTADNLTLTRPVAINENTDATYEATIPPQEIHTNIEPCIYHLDDFFSQFGEDIGVYFKNIESGFTYSWGADTVFFAASLNKATHALYTYIAAERGYISMDTVHTFRAEDFWGGTGIIRFMPAGTRFTTRELLRHAIVYSDNVAFRMLTRYMNRISFSYRDFVAEIGANSDFIISTYSHNTNAADTALWFYALHTYLESGSYYSYYLRDDLLNTALYSHPYFTRGGRFGGDSDVNVQFLHSDYPIAQKYGWFNGAFNTAGIVYAPSPFMLVIISNMDGGAHELFEEISWLMQEFNNLYFQV